MPHTATATDIAQTVLAGFNKHYRLFRAASAQAKLRFESADWQAQQQAQRERITFYDTRVRETVTALENIKDKHDASGLDAMVWTDLWSKAKLQYIGLLTHHLQPELAETFFNSVSCKILHRSYFHNECLFVRPAISTDYIENEEPASKPTYRVYYPNVTNRANFAKTVARMVNNFQLATPFADLERDAQRVAAVFVPALEAASANPSADLTWRDNLQIQVLSGLFFRNKAAYVVGRMVNGDVSLPFALPILHGKNGLFIDAALCGASPLLKLFSFARAYFMVDMAVPSAVVQFLRNLMPTKPRAELYNAIGLQKHGKTVFYRDVLYHLRHSTDQFRIAPGIKGMVMLVFDLPSFPYVFKLIKDFLRGVKVLRLDFEQPLR